MHFVFQINSLENLIVYRLDLHCRFDELVYLSQFIFVPCSYMFYSVLYILLMVNWKLIFFLFISMNDMSSFQNERNMSHSHLFTLKFFFF